MVTHFQCGNLCAIHAGRVTVMPKDFKLSHRVAEDMRRLDKYR